jgi:hypothetical protein
MEIMHPFVELLGNIDPLEIRKSGYEYCQVLVVPMWVLFLANCSTVHQNEPAIVY